MEINDWLVERIKDHIRNVRDCYLTVGADEEADELLEKLDDSALLNKAADYVRRTMEYENLPYTGDVDISDLYRAGLSYAEKAEETTELGKQLRYWVEYFKKSWSHRGGSTDILDDFVTFIDRINS